MASPKPRILYSEDDPDSREIVCLMLANAGFETICPDSSQDVLKVAKHGTFDCYLLDTWTPGMSGIEVCKKIRKDDTHTPIVFYSAAAFQRDKDEAFAAGAQAYITKPASMDELVYAIRVAISSSSENYSK